jgi:hypothetical protein
VIVHQNISFNVANHGAPFCGPWQRPYSLKTWFGVTGSLAVPGRVTHRELSVDVILSGYQKNGLLEDDIGRMATWLNRGLTGLLIIDGVRYPNSTFMGFEASAPAFYCGSGVNYWTQFGKLSWLQSS